MATPEPSPLILCMLNDYGQEVALNIDPGDDFHTFLRKAKDLLGFEIEVSSLTQREVSLSDNVHEFLINSQEENLRPVDVESGEPTSLAETSDESVYVLEDGRQIKQSQLNALQSENDDSPTKLDVDKIPFVKFAETKEETIKTPESPEVMKIVNISQTPPSRFKDEFNYKPNFINTIPFKAVPGHFLRHNQSGHNMYKPRKDFFQSYRPTMNKETITYDDIASMSRNQVVNLLKDTPVIRTIDIIEADEDKVKSKHVRKTDPCKPMTKKLYTSENRGGVDVTMSLGKVNGNNCCICKEMIENQLDEIYLFNSEDQKAYRSSPKKELATPLKIICKGCLKTYFKFCIELLSEKTLGEDEFLIIKRNQQYLYKNVIPLPNQMTETWREETVSRINEVKETSPQQNIPMEKGDEMNVKDDIVSANDIIRNDNEERQSKEDVIVIPDTTETTKADIKTPHKDANLETESSNSNVQSNAITNESLNDKEKSLKNDSKASELEKYDDVEFLDDLDDQVMNSVNKNHGLKCRFCGKVFKGVNEAIEHGTEHRLVDENVYPCPLCEYGYQTFAWLRGHMYSKHTSNNISISNESKHQAVTPTPSIPSGSGSGTPSKSAVESPVARRTRSGAARKRPNSKVRKDKKVKKIKKSKKIEKPTDEKESTADVIVIEEKEESSAADKCAKLGKTRTFTCPFCSKSFVSKETLAAHEARKCKNPRIIVAKKKPVIVKVLGSVATTNEDHILQKPDGRKRPRPINTKLVTCNDCGASFTSKVRLKFHIQFHNGSTSLSSEGRYLCEQCPSDLCSFDTEAELFDHVHFRHGKRRPWACQVDGCHKTFFMRAMLKKHGRTHTDTRPYICSECGKRFLDKQTLDEHGVTHLQTKPFQCHVCQKQLTRRSRLRMHVRAHGDVLAPRALRVCRACCRAFADLQRAQEHATTSQCAAKLKKEEDANTAAHSSESGATHSEHQNRPPDKPVEPEGCRILMNSIPKHNPPDNEEVQRMLQEMSEQTKQLIAVVETAKVFRCEYCEDVFYMTESLNSHRQCHAGVTNPFTCHICKVSFPTYSRCTTHKTTHGFYKRVVDSQDQPVLTEGGVILETGGGIVGYGDFPVAKHFLCQDCGRSYLHWTYLQVHRRMKHPTGEAVYTCAECELSFANSWGLAYHRKKTHGPKSENNEGQKENSNKNNNNPNAKFPCRDCGEVYFNRSALYTHRRKTHTTGRMRQIDKGLGLFACASCSKCYASKPGLEAHLRGPATRACRSATAAPYACARCGAAFAFCAHLARHVLDAHADEASHMCSWCGARFASRSELAAHARSHSPPERAHVCRVCGRYFRTASMRAEHARTHTGERPYPCDVCGVAFRRSTARNNHRLIHTGERAYGCPRCSKSYRIRSDLRAHMKTKHPEMVQVLEMRGLEPNPGDVILQLRLNNIALDRVADIQKVSFPKGSPDLVLSGDLASLDNLQNVQDERGRVWSERVMAAVAHCLPQSAVDGYREFDAEDAWRHVQGTSRRDRLQPTTRDGIDLHYGDTDTFHVAIKDVAVEELTQLLGGVLTSDGTGLLLTSGQFVPFDATLAASTQENKNADENAKSHQKDQHIIKEITRSFREDDYYKGLAQLLQESEKEGMAKHYPQAQNDLNRETQVTQQGPYNFEQMPQSTQQNQIDIEREAQATQQEPCNLEGLAQSVEPAKSNLEGMATSTQQIQYNIEGITQSNQQEYYTMGQIALSTQKDQYKADGMAHATQPEHYNLERIVQPTQQDQYNMEGIAQSTQQGQYNLEEISQATQHKQYNSEQMQHAAQERPSNLEGPTESTQLGQFNLEGVALSTQHNQYNLDGMVQSTQHNQYHLESVSHATQQGQYDLEGTTQSTQHGQYNLEGMAQNTQQEPYNLERMGQSTQQNQYSLDIMSLATQHGSYNLQEMPQSTQRDKYNLEAMAPTTEQDQYNIQGITPSTLQEYYKMEGMAQSIQQHQYNIGGTSQATQKDQYKVEEIPQVTQSVQYNLEGIAHPTQNSKYNLEGMIQTTHQDQYNIERIVQSTEQGQYNLEEITQATQQDQHNIGEMAQVIHQDQYNMGIIAQSPQIDQYKIEEKAQDTQNIKYNLEVIQDTHQDQDYIEGIPRSTQQDQYNFEKKVQSTQENLYNTGEITQPIQMDQNKVDGIAQATQPHQYNIEEIAQPTEQDTFTLEGMIKTTHQDQYNIGEIPQSTQQDQYNFEKMAQSTHQNLYNIEGIAQSTQQDL